VIFVKKKNCHWKIYLNHAHYEIKSTPSASQMKAVKKMYFLKKLLTIASTHTFLSFKKLSTRETDVSLQKIVFA
jgi:hypothetical protein